MMHVLGLIFLIVMLTASAIAVPWLLFMLGWSVWMAWHDRQYRA